MKKAFIFDVGGVLIDNPWAGMGKHYSQALGVDLDAFIHAHAQYEIDLHNGAMSLGSFWKKISQDLRVEYPTSDGDLLWREGIARYWSEKREVIELIKKLKSQGYKTGILSNTETPVADVITQNIGHHFDVLVFSCIEGYRKPDRTIYEITLERLGVLPHESVFIDDKKENVEAARLLGITGIHFQTIEQFQKEIEQLI